MFFSLLFFFNADFIFSLEILPKNTHLDFYLDKEAHGEKLTVPGINLCIYETADGKNLNFGISMNAESICKNLPWMVKAGNINPVALYSKLKSPILNSTVLPFGSAAGEASCVNVNLPSHVSFNKPSSYFLQCGYTNSKTVLRNILVNYWNSYEETIEVVSGKIKLVPFTNFTVAASACAGFFDYSENNSSSWFMEEPYYHSGKHFCTIGQFSAAYANQKTLFTIGLFENPYGSYESVYRGETKIKSDHFIFTLSGAYVPEKCITCDDTTLSPQVQIKAGSQYFFITGNKLPVFVKTGFCLYSKINLEEKNILETAMNNSQIQNHPLKLALGLQISSSLTSINFTTTASGSAKITDAGTTQLHFDNGGFSLKNTWYFNIFCPSVLTSINFNPSEDYTALTTVQNYEVNYAFSGNPNITDKYKVSITRKNGQKEKTSFSSTVNFKTKVRQISCTLKFGMSIDF